MTTNYEVKFKELQGDPLFLEKVAAAQTAEDYITVYSEFGIELTESEAEDIVKLISNPDSQIMNDDAELTMEEMDQVNGGLVIAGVVIPAILWKTALALVAACGVVAGIKKLKKEFSKYF